MSDIKVGDRVRVVSEYTDGTGSINGRVGAITRIDSGDVVFPYRVLLDGDSEYDATWVYEVRPLEHTPAHADRESLVTLAKTLLAGTPHTVADIIAMANFLAGE
ncbi:hypothetical protein ACTFBT_00990 [Streptomyces microflavus]|uniref:Uncharacterized protein n=1 Tax=Streptomyces microflavus TaxID=1919 RepID=A0A7J0D487_STRMI|nr:MULTISPECIES: hypothetical protein [Streptomyces]MDX2978196.1 hypothetical protein [Streptomyces sp. NRRL_B-2249]GFN09508.1 hypothetical protein Smic_80640 [Streptomyces microflavus]GGX67487.1 hypothetical protein GCM10010298_35340 [Streptomyces microflavus]